MVGRTGVWRMHAGLACVLFAALATVSKAEGQEQYSCQAIGQIPQPQRCEFVTKECDSHARIPFLELYYCKVEPAGTLAKVPFVLLLCMLLPLLFTLLGDTAETYFSPTMALVAQSIPKMRPRFAGVTFVAMGNGAADLSANISAIRNGSVQLSAGAFTGAAMFVQCVVASEVIRVSKGAPCRGATLRDVATYALSIIGVALSFASGTITRWFVAGALTMYALYAAWVFGGDEWHARGRPRPNISWSQLLEMLWQRSRGAEHVPQWAALDAAEPLLPADSLPEQTRPSASVLTSRAPSQAHSRKPHLLDAETYRQAVWADLSSDPTLMAAVRTGRPVRSRESDSASLELQTGVSGSVSTLPYAYTLSSSVEAVSTPLSPLHEASAASVSSVGGRSEPAGGQEGHGQRGRLLVPPPSHLDMESLGADGTAGQGPGLPLGSAQGLGVGGVASGGPVSLAALRGRSVLPLPGGAGAADDREATLRLGSHAGGTAGSTPPGGATAASGIAQQEARGAADSIWQQVCNELTVGAAKEWPHLRGVRRRFRTITFPLLLPIYAALRFTIPFIDPATYSQRWLVATMLCAPVATAAYLDAWTAWPMLLALCIGVSLALGVHVLTKDEEELPALDLGTRFAFAPAVFSLMGFFMGALWIDTLAGEVVGILSLLASLASLPSSLMGLTLLAWGSSLGDFFGNPALARRGHASTALTACFAGPLFNMLVSLGLGFLSNFASHGTSSLKVRLSPDVLLGCVFLVSYNALVAIVGFSNGFRLPERFYLFARVWYGLYLVLACGLGFAEMLGWGAV